MDLKEINSDTNESGNNLLPLKRPSPDPSAEIQEKMLDSTAGRWTTSEHLKFVEGSLHFSKPLGLQKYGKKWRYMQKDLPTRTSSQIRTHAQKFFIRLKAKIGGDDDELLEYVQGKPAQYFVSGSHKFAKLTIDEQGSLSSLAQSQKQLFVPPSSFCAPKMLVTNLLSGERRSLMMEQNEVSDVKTPTVLIPHSGLNPARSSLKSGEYAAANNGHKFFIKESAEEIKNVKAEYGVIPPCSGVPGGLFREQTGLCDLKPSPFGHTPVASSISTIIKENLVLNENLRNSFASLAAFSQKLSGANGSNTPSAAKHTNYLLTSGMELQNLMQNMINSLSKSTALIQQFVMQTLVWSNGPEPVLEQYNHHP